MKAAHTRRQKEFPPAYRLAPLLVIALLAVKTDGIDSNCRML
jgi:hypothetical protein